MGRRRFQVGGVVSAANSLVGTQTKDSVGTGGVTLLKNGNAVVASFSWSNGTATGGVTWINGQTGLTGAVSSMFLAIDRKCIGSR